jgi:hypothetical protein
VIESLRNQLNIGAWLPCFCLAVAAGKRYLRVPTRPAEERRNGTMHISYALTSAPLGPTRDVHTHFTLMRTSTLPSQVGQ